VREPEMEDDGGRADEEERKWERIKDTLHN
jgi:hypothetical protein